MKNIETGSIVLMHPEDPRLYSGEWVGINKGKAVLIHKETGKRRTLDPKSQEYQTGNYVTIKEYNQIKARP